MDLSCHACGSKFRSAIAEARHRHNFPALCKRNKRFQQFVARNHYDALVEAAEQLLDMVEDRPIVVKINSLKWLIADAKSGVYRP